MSKYYLIKASGLEPIRIEYCYWDKKVDIVELTDIEVSNINTALLDTAFQNRQMCKITHTRPNYSKNLEETANKIRKVLE